MKTGAKSNATFVSNLKLVAKDDCDLDVREIVS